MPRVESDTLYGTLNLLILKALSAGPLHGLAILHALEAGSGEVVQVEEGALYPALHRLERDGLGGGVGHLAEGAARKALPADPEGPAPARPGHRTLAAARACGGVGAGSAPAHRQGRGLRRR